MTVSIDARNFEKAAQSALATGKNEELCHACSLYYGEFLSQMTGEKVGQCDRCKIPGAVF